MNLWCRLLLSSVNSSAWRTPQDNIITAKNSESDESAVDPFQLVRRIKGRGPAPVHLWNPPFCGDIDMRIACDGSWFHDGEPIRRPAMVNLFASVLKREDDGDYYLVTPVEKVRIQVEDCPFVAILMETEGEGKSRSLVFTTNTGESIAADSEHPIMVDEAADSGEPHPVVHVRDGLNALINRAVFYRLVELAEQQELAEDIVTGVWSNDCFFELGRQPKEAG